MSRANNSVWGKLSNTLSEVLASTLDKATVDSVMTAWESKKKEVSRLVDTTPKKKSDPNAPKRPNTSYIFFCNDQRERVKAKNPTLSATELMKKISEEWKVVSDKDKKKYEELAKKDKERYENQRKSYTPPPETETKARKQKSDGPKRPLTAYMYFCQAERDNVKKAHPSMSGKEITTELGARWKALPDSQKSPYEAKQVADKERYETEKGVKGKPKKDVREPKKESKKTEAKKEVKKTETKKQVKKTEKKESGKTPGFEFFFKEQSKELRTENPKLTDRQVSLEVSKRWKALPANEKEAYENEAKMGDDEVELEDE